MALRENGENVREIGQDVLDASLKPVCMASVAEKAGVRVEDVQAITAAIRD